MASETEFTRLIQEHQGLLMKVASIYTNTATDREDLFQEIVYQLWKCFDSFKGESKITTWMYRVGMNTAITHLKKSKKQASLSSWYVEMPAATDKEDALYEERLALVHTYIQTLNALEKGLMLLVLEGKSYGEIAEITGLTSSNVGTRISRIKNKMKSNIVKK
ncbi:RNA polymerase sigma factor [Maribacter chungangensis]|uniref:RNA polymerase sigma factor n=1 Tax=Maribacter chungangensis TaxID=1069117 RepID=A0ABW3B4E6_9FLAO